MFKLLYLLSPLVSVVLAARGYSAPYILIGIGVSMLMLFLDSVAVALRGFGLLGVDVVTDFVLRMVPGLLTMIVPATIWNAVAFALGWVISGMIP